VPTWEDIVIELEKSWITIGCCVKVIGRGFDNEVESGCVCVLLLTVAPITRVQKRLSMSEAG
jgi:hypothetical protein